MTRNLLCAALAALALPALAADPILLSAVSRKTHGAAGVYDIPLVANEGYTEPAGTVEPRSGPYYHVVFAWNREIASAECQGVSAGPTYGPAIISGSNVICPIHSTLNGVWALVNVVVETHDHRFGEALTKVGLLLGDVNGDCEVTPADKAIVNAQIAQRVGPGNFRSDVNANGYLTVADLGITNARVGTVLP